MVNEEYIFGIASLIGFVYGLLKSNSNQHDKHTSKKRKQTRYQYKKIDLHTHILPRTWPNLKQKYGYGGWIQLEHEANGKAIMMKDEEFFREVEANCYDPEAILKDMDEYGVDVQVICTVPVMFSYWAKPEHCIEISKFLNDNIAATVQKHPTRFIALGTIPMNSPLDAVAQLEYCVNELNFPGVQIGSNVNQINLSDPMFHPIWEKANELECCMFVHPWAMMGKQDMEKYWLPWLVGMPAETSRAICSLIFSGLLDRFPKIRWCFAHAGGSFPATLGRIEHGWRVRPDLCAIDCKKNPREYCGRFWIDSITHDESMLQKCIDTVGSDKICLGSDYPFPLGELEFGHYPGKLVEHSQFDESIKENILWNNAFEFLGVDSSLYISSN